MLAHTTDQERSHPLRRAITYRCGWLSCVRSLLARAASAALALLAAFVLSSPALAGGAQDAPPAIPITVPPFHGLEPDLRLVYSSGGGNDLVGVGWSLSGLSYISRVAGTRGSPLWDGSDGYMLDGQPLVPCAAGSDSPSCLHPVAGLSAFTTRVETFQRIAYDAGQAGGRWYVWRTNGVKLTYAPHQTTYIAPVSWHLALAEDARGNVVSYQYAADGSNAPVLETISYNGTVVRFHRELRPDVVTSATGGHVAALRFRIRTIEVSTGGQRARAYALHYTVRDTSGNRSLLLRVQEYGRDAVIDGAGAVVGGTALPPHTFTWAADGGLATWRQERQVGASWGGAPQSSSGFDTPFTTGINLGATSGAGTVFAGDFDGDGRADRVQVLYNSSTGELTLNTALAEPNGAYTTLFRRQPIAAGLPAVNQIWPAELNGDGKLDLLLTFLKSEPVSGGWVTRVHLLAALSNGDGSFWLPTGTPQATDWRRSTASNGTVTAVYCQVGAFNGDGRSAIACSYQRDGGHYIGTASLRGDYTFALAGSQAPFAGTLTYPIRSGDFNADGYDDLVAYTGQPVQLSVALSRGVGVFTFRQPVASPWSRDGEIYVAELNGDGRADLVQLEGNIDGHTTIQTALAHAGGLSFQPAQALPTPIYYGASMLTLGDANGDSLTDIFVAVPYEATWPCTGGVPSTLVTRVFARGDGSFDLPPNWSDCNRAQAVKVKGIFALDSEDARRARPQPLVAAPDANGDGLSDFQAAQKAVASNVMQIVTGRSRRTAMGSGAWMQADITGDGIADAVAITSGGSGVRVQALLRGRDGAVTSVVRDLLPDLSNPVAGNWKLGDVDGDGRADLVYLMNDTVGSFRGLRAFTLLASGDGGWRELRQNVWPNYGGVSGGTRGRDTRAWRSADVNGDGRSDLARVSFNAHADAVMAIDALLANADGSWTVSQSGATLDMVDRRDLLSDTAQWLPADSNGDGRTDLIHIGYTAPGLRVRTLLARPQGGWLVKSHETWPSFGAPNTAAWRIADVNGDGKSDLVHLYNLSPGMRIHTLVHHGDGAWDLFGSDFSGNGALDELLSWRIADLNRDGKSDLVHLEQWDGRLWATPLLAGNTGTWEAGQWRLVPATYAATGRGPASGWSLTDVDGDGSADLAHVDLAATTLTLRTAAGSPTRDLLVASANGQGATTQIAYRPSSSWQPSSPAAGCVLPGGMVLDAVASVVVRDGRGGEETTTSSYACPHWSQQERAFVGWQRVTETHQYGSARPASVSVRTYRLRDVNVAELLTDTLQDGEGKIIRQTTLSYVERGAAMPYRSLVQSRIEAECNRTTTCNQQQTDYAYDGFGNTTTETAYNGLSGSAAQIILSNYNPAPRPYIVSAPSAETVMASEGGATATLRQVVYCYDGDNTACNQPPTRGLVTALRALDNQTNSYVTTLQSYDAYGNLTQSVDANGHATTSTYDATYHRFPTSICNARGQCAQQQWDTVLGLRTRLSDTNGQVTVYEYDSLGRQVRTTLPSGQQVATAYLDLGNPALQRTVETVVVEDGTRLSNERYHDGLGRVWRETRSEGQNVLRRDTEFVAATGQARSQSHWYRAAGETPVYELFAYDAAGRLTSQTHPDGSRLVKSYANSHNRAWESTADERGGLSTISHDALGRVVTVREENAGVIGDTHYSYDMLDRLVAVTDSAGNVLSQFSWDSLGRRRSHRDADLGLTSYTYDAVGNLLSETDARGVTTTYSYDELNRVVGKSNDGQTTWRYDEAGHGAGVGRLTSVSDPSGAGCPGGQAESLSYTAMGQVASRTKCVAGVSYTLSFTYDRLGRPATITYPDGEVASYRYDAAGRLSQVLSSRGTAYVSAISYTAAGQVSAMTYGNGTVSTFAYDPRREWLTTARVERGGTTLYQAQYSYLPDGLVQSIASPTNQMNQRFSYDALDRLVEVSGDFAQSFRYDALGNMTFNSALGEYRYPASGPNGCGAATPCARVHAVQQAGTRSYEYDARGNLTVTRDSATQRERRIVWNADGLPAEVFVGGARVMRATYDAQGERVLVERAGTTRYFGPLLEETPEGLAAYYFAGDQLVARRDRSGVVWFHGDHLGSTRLLTNQAGEVAQRYDYRAFGELAGGSGTVNSDIQYTGHRSEAEAGLIYMHARYYDPQLGRFTAADTVVPRLYDPQSLNRYSYVVNSPLNRIDPTGHDDEVKGEAKNEQAPASEANPNGRSGQESASPQLSEQQKDDIRKKAVKMSQEDKQKLAGELEAQGYTSDDVRSAVYPSHINLVGAYAENIGDYLVERGAEITDKFYMLFYGPPGYDTKAGLDLVADGLGHADSASHTGLSTTIRGGAEAGLNAAEQIQNSYRQGTFRVYQESIQDEKR